MQINKYLNKKIRLFYTSLFRVILMNVIIPYSQLVREQMKKSLEIIKDLEEQVKMVPMLKVIYSIQMAVVTNKITLEN